MTKKNQKPSVVFLVANFTGRNTGLGGHYRSISTVADALGSRYDVTIVCIGDSLAPGIQAKHAEVKLLKCNWYAWTAHIVNQSSIFECKPSAVIAAGASLCYPVAAICSDKKIPLIGLRAGGPRNPGWELPTTIQIHFSKKDAEIASANTFINSHWIPNRVGHFERDENWTNELSRHIPEFNGITVGHVARLSPDKLGAHLAALRYAGMLNSAGIHARCVILGAENCMQTLNAVLRAVDSNDRVLTYASLTKDARQLCFHVDAMVGMGRSFIESALAGVPTLAYSAHNVLPTVVTKERFSVFLADNFSYRCHFPQAKQENIDELLAFSRDAKYRLAVSKGVHELAMEHCSIERGVGLYDQAIQAAVRMLHAGHISMLYRRRGISGVLRSLVGLSRDLVTADLPRLRTIYPKS